MNSIFFNPNVVFESPEKQRNESDDDLDDIVSSISHANLSSPPETPSPVKSAITMLKKSTPGRTATRRERDDFSRLEGMIDTRSRKKLLQSFEEDALPRINGASTQASDPNKSVLFNVENVDDEFVGSWMEELLGILSRAGDPIHVVNTGHITQPQGKRNQTTGFHFCPPGHPQENCILKRVESPYSPVWFAEFDAGRGKKMSSFFPRNIQDKDQLMTVLANGEKVAQTQNRALFFTQTEIPFYFEMYYRGTCIITAFPIYYFSNFYPDMAIHLTQDFQLPIAPIYEKLRTLNEYDIQEYHRFTLTENDSTYHILDIAPLLGHPIVDRGVYIKFPASDLPNLHSDC